jgi:hypothetical protein
MKVYDALTELLYVFIDRRENNADGGIGFSVKIEEENVVNIRKFKEKNFVKVIEFTRKKLKYNVYNMVR